MLTQQETLSELAMAVAEHETRLPELEQMQQNTQFAHQNQQNELNRIKRELALKQQQQQHIIATLENHAKRGTALQEEQAALNLPQEQELNTAQEQAEILQNQYDESESVLLDVESRLAEMKGRVQAAETEYQQYYQQHLNAQAQQQALATLLQDHNTADFGNTPNGRLRLRCGSI